jgi:hypothetical protein
MDAKVYKWRNIVFFFFSFLCAFFCRAEELQVLKETKRTATATSTSSSITSTNAIEHCKSIRINQDDSGITYDSLFGEYLRVGQPASVNIDDPYIRSTHQIYNFLRFCECVVRTAPSVRQITLTTTNASGADTLGKSGAKESTSQQQQAFEEMKRSCAERGITLAVLYSTTLHDRQICIDNGYVIKIGRGLDIFQRSSAKFALGYWDVALRKTLETNVDVYRRRQPRQ